MQTLYDRPDVRTTLQALAAEECQDFARQLSPREAVVLHGRFLGKPPRRWESLARTMGLTRDRVRQLEIEIIKKLDAWQATRTLPSDAPSSPA
jgi:DNA-directed RNA polymerase sigma subunit (sigma70/sigma32)